MRRAQVCSWCSPKISTCLTISVLSHQRGLKASCSLTHCYKPTPLKISPKHYNVGGLTLSEIDSPHHTPPTYIEHRHQVRGQCPCSLEACRIQLHLCDQAVVRHHHRHWPEQGLHVEKGKRWCHEHRHESNEVQVRHHHRHWQQGLHAGRGRHRSAKRA